MKSRLAAARRELSDRAAIHDILLSYAAGVDRRDLARVASLFVAGAPYEGALGVGTIETALAGLASRWGRYDQTLHWIAHQLIEVAGDRACSETYAVAYHLLKQAPPANFVVGVRYLDELARRGNGWLISRRVVTSEWQHHELIGDRP
ncbi:MAG TPA: nuclear transport factor 2 family protein [Candidatus Kryptonia bacterium]|nr:nuclear transport factor 2 family protein [Candidatus Kryptonia bacterium]